MGSCFILWPTFFSLLPLSGGRWIPRGLKPTLDQENFILVWPLLSLVAKRAAFQAFFMIIFCFLPSLFLSIFEVVVWERRNLSSGHSTVILLDSGFQRFTDIVYSPSVTWESSENDMTLGEENKYLCISKLSLVLQIIQNSANS